MEFDAASFSTAWLCVANAMGRDRESPMFDRTIGVHWYEDRGVRLVASDRYVMAVAWVPEWGTEADAPRITEAADDEWVAFDPDGRVAKLMDHVIKRCLVRQREADPEASGFPADTMEVVNLTRSRKRQIQRLRLADAEGELDTVIDFMGEEHVALESLMGRFPGWEKLVSERVRGGSAASALILTPSTLAKLAGLSKILSKATGGLGGKLILGLDGAGGTVMATTNDVPGIMTFATSESGARFLNVEEDTDAEANG